jgi:predicted dehydrogenase
MREIGCAVIGLGVGEQHARALACTPGCRIRFLHDLDRRRAERLAVALGQGAVASSFEQVIADPAVELVVIASYDDAHAGQVVAALEAGKHVFCEKPLCRTAEELASIAQAWRRSGRSLGCNLVLRAAPLYRWLREAIAAGELGRIYAFDGDYLYGRLWKITEGWRADVPDYSVLQGGGIHLLDLLLWTTAQVPARAWAVGNRIVTEGTRFRYHDYVSATFEFPSGLIGRITANVGCVHRHQHVVRVFGERATFLYDDQGPRLYRARDPGEPPRWLQHSPHPASKGDLIPAFVESIRAGGDRHGTEHELRLIAACLAADRALSERAPVAVETMRWEEDT